MNFAHMAHGDASEIADFISSTENELTEAEQRALLLNAFKKIAWLERKVDDLEHQIEINER